MDEAAMTTRGTRGDDCDNDTTIARSRSPHRVVVVTVARRCEGRAREGRARAREGRARARARATRSRQRRDNHAAAIVVSLSFAGCSHQRNRCMAILLNQHNRRDRVLRVNTEAGVAP